MGVFLTFYVKFFLGDKNIFILLKIQIKLLLKILVRKLTIHWDKVLIIKEKFPENFFHVRSKY